MVQTTAGTWITHLPTRCPNGHTLAPGEVLVGHQACLRHTAAARTMCGATPLNRRGLNARDNFAHRRQPSADVQGNAIGQLTAEGDNKARRSAAFYARRLISLQKPLGRSAFMIGRATTVAGATGGWFLQQTYFPTLRSVSVLDLLPRRVRRGRRCRSPLSLRLAT